jgi:hypothetical protein
MNQSEFLSQFEALLSATSSKLLSIPTRSLVQLQPSPSHKTLVTDMNKGRIPYFQQLLYPNFIQF